MGHGVVLGSDEHAVAAAGNQPDQSFGAALVELNLAGGQRRQHDAVALNVRQLGVQPMFGEQAKILGHPKRREAAADRGVADGDGGEFFVLRMTGGDQAK